MQSFRPHPATERIIDLYDAGKPLKEIARTVGISSRAVDNIIAKEKARREGKQDAEIPVEMLSLPAREKFEKIIAREKERLRSNFRVEVIKEAEKEINLRLEVVAKRWREQRAVAKRVMDARKGFMTRETYKLILSCLHPDWVTDLKQKIRYESAFKAFKNLEKCVLNETDSPTDFMSLPRTRAEWDAMRRARTKGKAQVIMT